MRKLSEINEGMWKSGLDRAKSGEKRLEDTTILDKYLKTVEWVDIGHKDYLFAKFDMDYCFSLSELLELELPKDIKIVDFHTMLYLKDTLSTYQSKEKYLAGVPEKGATIFFELFSGENKDIPGTMYLCDFTEDDANVHIAYFRIRLTHPQIMDTDFLNVLKKSAAFNAQAFNIKLMKKK